MVGNLLGYLHVLYDGKTIESLIRQIPRLIKQLDTLYSEIFNLKGYRLYGASLLLMYDGDANKSNSKRKKLLMLKST